ncbi:MAG: NAD(P)/FAD-dependent oxidoreductase [Anaerolineae bacterium]
MKTISCDVLVIGSGPAGLAAATRAREEGARDVLVLERNPELGGILPQCIHNGFGVRVFGSDLTGPEYAQRWIQRALSAGVALQTGTMVLEIRPGPTLIASSARDGLMEVRAKALVLAMGCRERPRGALAIPGTRPAGVYTAGTAQRLVNMEGYVPGEGVVILGSGDIGMIMARRLTLEGAKVKAMLEVQPWVSGLRRNLVQCVQDYDIPLYTQTTVVEVRGRERVEEVVAARVDTAWQPIAGTEWTIGCDTLLLSVGLVPENELSRQVGVQLDDRTGGPLVDERYATSLPGVFAAGNVVHVYDVVDDVSEVAMVAGESAARWAAGGDSRDDGYVPVRPGENVHHVVPQRVRRERPRDGLTLALRVMRPIEAPAVMTVRADGELLVRRRLRYARPSEMLIIEVSPSKLGDLDGRNELVVKVAALG